MAHRVWSGILSDIQQVKWCNPKVQRSYRYRSRTLNNRKWEGWGMYRQLHSCTSSLLQPFGDTDSPWNSGDSPCDRQTNLPRNIQGLWLAPKQELCSDTHQFALHHSAFSFQPLFLPSSLCREFVSFKSGTSSISLLQALFSEEQRLREGFDIYIPLDSMGKLH